MQNSMIEHSAEGSSWTKKNHKYIRKENGRYIYPEDLNRRTKDARDIVKEQGIYKTEKVGNSARHYSYRNNKETGTISVGAATSSIGDSNKGVFEKHTRKNKSAREIISEGKNQRANEYNNIRIGKETEAREQRRKVARNNVQVKNRGDKLLREEQNYQKSTDQQKRNDKYRNFGSNAMPVAARNKQYEHTHPEEDAKMAGYLKRSKENRYKSAVTPYRERSGNPSRVEYTTDINGNIHRKVTSKNDEGVKTTKNSVVKRSRTARDIISDKGIKRVSYNDNGKDRYRTTTYNDFTKDREKVDKNTGNPDTRNVLQKKISEIKRKKEAKEYRKTQKRLAKEQEKAQKIQAKEEAKAKREREKEIDKTLPASMKRKRNIKRGKKAVQKIIDKIAAPIKKTGNLGEHTTKETHTEKWVDENGYTHIPMNQSYVYDKKKKQYVRTN